MTEPERPPTWAVELQTFFEARARTVRGRRLSNAELCYVSAREPRLWSDERLYEDLIDSIRSGLVLEEDHRLLEVGCAAGFLARGLTGCVRRYVGVDLARAAAAVARSQRLPGAAFVQGDGARLPFADDTFDRVVSYDVFTNIPDWTTAEAIAVDMVRVARPGGRVMIGSVPDAATRERFERVVQDVVERLDRAQGPVPEMRPPLWRRWRRSGPAGQIVCHYFTRDDFLSLGRRLGVEVRLDEIHALNPYAGYRFNVVCTKPGR